MTDTQVQKLKALKQKFRDISPKEREVIGVCFLKLKLGVHNLDEFNVVSQFLDDFKMDISPENLDSMINYLHSQNHSLPEFIAMEDSLSEIETDSDLPPYNADDVDTLKEGLKPLKDK